MLCALIGTIRDNDLTMIREKWQNHTARCTSCAHQQNALTLIQHLQPHKITEHTNAISVITKQATIIELLQRIYRSGQRCPFRQLVRFGKCPLFKRRRDICTLGSLRKERMKICFKFTMRSKDSPVEVIDPGLFSKQSMDPW